MTERRTAIVDGDTGKLIRDVDQCDEIVRGRGDHALAFSPDSRALAVGQGSLCLGRALKPPWGRHEAKWWSLGLGSGAPQTNTPCRRLRSWQGRLRRSGVKDTPHEMTPKARARRLWVSLRIEGVSCPEIAREI